MDDRTVDLACAALEEFLRAGRFGGKNGEAVTAFLEHMDHHPSALVPRGGHAALESASGAGGDEASAGRLQSLQEQLEAARTDLARCESALQQAERKNEDLSGRLKAVQDKLTSLETTRLPEQEELCALQQFLNAVPQEMREIVSTYFTPQSLSVFLIQCGQFSRLNQLWESCGKAIATGRSPAGMTSFLEKLLEIFNRASGQNPATLISPAPGDAYRSEIHFRVNSDGTTVRKLLLPGLRNPGGKMQQPALVELK